MPLLLLARSGTRSIEGTRPTEALFRPGAADGGPCGDVAGVEGAPTVDLRGAFALQYAIDGLLRGVASRGEPTGHEPGTAVGGRRPSRAGRAVGRAQGRQGRVSADGRHRRVPHGLLLVTPACPPDRGPELRRSGEGGGAQLGATGPWRLPSSYRSCPTVSSGTRGG